MSYSKINWKDYPDTATPITAENLNKMDAQIKENADDIEDIKTYQENNDTTISNMQDEIDNIEVVVADQEWVDNFLKPTVDEGKEIGTYSAGPHYQKLIMYTDIITERANVVTLSISDITGFDYEAGTKGHITGIVGTLTDGTEGYPVGYTSFDGTTSFQVDFSESTNELHIRYKGMQPMAAKTVRLTITYIRYMI